MNEDRIIKKLEEHDGRFTNIEQKLENHDHRFQRIDEKLEEHSDILAVHEEQLEFLRQNVVLRDEIVRREEFDTFKDQMLTGQDQMMTILKRLDQERVFTNVRLDRIEQTLTVHIAQHS